MYHVFTRFIDYKNQTKSFDNLLNIFLQLLNITAGNVEQSLKILYELKKKYNISDKTYNLEDFIENLKRMKYIEETTTNDKITYKVGIRSETTIRKKSLELIFEKLKNNKIGDHASRYSGKNGEEIIDSYKQYEFGDSIEQVDFITSFKNSQIKKGIETINLEESDLQVFEKEKNISSSTVLLIDISHSMILYGEDRMTPAKNAAMALAELIKTKFPKDTLDIVAFGDDARVISVRDILYLQAGPFHTNLCAGLQMAQNLLKRKKTSNKNIFLITDGKPSCIKEGASYYKNSFGLDPKIVNKTLDEAAKCKKAGITITTLMIARDPYLQKFVKDFAKVNGGRAFLSSPVSVGEYIVIDYLKNRVKKTK